jgi:hypothetical protein
VDAQSFTTYGNALFQKMNKADLKLHQVVRELRTAPEGSNGKKRWDKAVEVRNKLDQYSRWGILLWTMFNAFDY